MNAGLSTWFVMAVLWLMVGTICAQQNLVVAGTNSTYNLDASQFPPEIESTFNFNFTLEGVAHLEAADGTLICWATWAGIFDANGGLLPGAQPLLGGYSTSEFSFCPIPSLPNHYYLLYSLGTCGAIYASIVAVEGTTAQVVENDILFMQGNFSEAIEVVQLPCKNAYRIFVFDCDEGFTTIEVTYDGVEAPQLLHPFSPEDGFDGRGILEVYSGRIGMTFAYSPSIFFADYDLETNTLTNPQPFVEFWDCPDGSFLFSGAYGLAFTEDGSRAWVSNWLTCFNNALQYYDFDSGTWTLVDSYFNLGQIRRAPDGTMYVASFYDLNVDLVAVVNPESDDFTLEEIDLPETSALGITEYVEFDPTGWVHLAAQSGCDPDSVGVLVDAALPLTAANASLTVDGEPVVIAGLLDGFIPLEVDGEGPVEVILEVTSEDCTYSISDSLQVFSANVDLLPEAASGCDAPGVTLTLDAEVGEGTWPDGSLSTTYVVEESGTVVVSANLGTCEIADSIQVTVVETPQVSINGLLALCNNTPTVLEGAVTVGDFSWNTGATSTDLTVSEPGTYVLSATNGACAAADSVVVTGVDVPDLNLPTDTVVCSQTPLVLQAAPGFDQYVWTGGLPGSTVVLFESGVYEVVATLDGCQAEASVAVEVVDAPPLTLTGEAFVCDQSETVWQATTPGEITWPDGSSEESWIIDSPGQYTVAVTLGECDSETEFVVDFGTTPEPQLPASIEACEAAVVLQAPDAESITWSTGDTSPNLIVESSGLYGLTVANGPCAATAQVAVTLYDAEATWVVPNVFTPNGDGLNDAYTLPQEPRFEVTWSVFDRWGNRLFDSDQGPEWPADGYASGTYYVLIEGEDLCTAVSLNQSVAVTLLRD